jgi:hypothetical protein
MGHEQTSTALDIYAHAPDDYEQRVLSAFEGSAVLSLSSEINGSYEGDEGDFDHMP